MRGVSAAARPDADVRMTPALGASRSVAWFGVAILCLIYMCSFIDRQIVALLAFQIRTDLRISDTQFSLLQGFAFAILYAALGLPIGRWVDRADRRWVLVAGTITWSVFTSLCGTAVRFSDMFLYRIGVGAGEATVVPVTYSLLGDYFTRAKRGFAMGAFGVGVYAGMGLAMIVGSMVVAALGKIDVSQWGVLRGVSPWRLVFFCVGLPGVALSLFGLALYEPRKVLGAAREPRAVWWPHARQSLGAILCHHLATALLAMALYTLTLWAPELYRRVFGVAGSMAGIQIGLAILIGGGAGVIAGGVASDALLRWEIRSARLLTLAVAAICAIPFALFFPLAKSAQEASILLGAAVFFTAALTSAGPAGIQELYPPSLRGIGASIYQLSVNLIGLGLGPTVVALVEDHVLNNESHLDQALAFSVPGMLLVAAGIAVSGLGMYGRAVETARA